MNGRIYHQYRSTYVFGEAWNQETRDAAVQALKDIGITEWSRLDWEPLHFENRAGVDYLAYGHGFNTETLYGYRFVNVERPEGMPVIGWQDQQVTS